MCWQANLFIPASMLVDQLSVELTGASAYAGGPVAWHDMVYFSFTTLGYGDIAPVNPVSQALAIAEAILGVLTVALIIGRLVGAATGVRRRHEREHGA